MLSDTNYVLRYPRYVPGLIHGPVFWGGTHYGHSAIHPYFL